MSKSYDSNLWHHVQTYQEYVDFDKEVLSCDDDGNTSLDVRLTFNTETRSAYMVVSWHNDDGNTLDLSQERPIDWDAALRMIEPDLDIPEELK